MTNSPAIEVIETLTFPMMSNEIQTGDVELTVTCRVAWDISNGIYCEPTSYNYDGKDYKFGIFMQAAFDAFIKEIARSEMTPDHLENILREHPAFEEARRHEFDLLDIDRVEYMEAVY